MILSHQVNLQKALVPLPAHAPLSNHVRAPSNPHPFSVVEDVLGNTIGTSDCVSLRVQETQVILKKKIQKKIYKKTNTKKISFLGQSFLQVLMNIFLNPYKFYVFNIS